MVRLDTYTGSRTFYFKSMDDCNTFMKVFKENLCGILWQQPIEADSFPEVPQHRYGEINRDPEERAEESLDWGFNLIEFRENINLYECEGE